MKKGVWKLNHKNQKIQWRFFYIAFLARENWKVVSIQLEMKREKNAQTNTNNAKDENLPS